jgi:hypothetical protein
MAEASHAEAARCTLSFGREVKRKIPAKGCLLYAKRCTDEKLTIRNEDPRLMLTAHNTAHTPGYGFKKVV